MIGKRGKSIDALADSLLEDGIALINKAKHTNETQTRTFNMQDAYGCAVYFNGKIIRKGYANNSPIAMKPHNGWKRHGIQPSYGRGDLEKFFSTYKPPTNGIFLVCVNAVFYAPILEDGAQSKLKVKYRIISQVDNEFDKLARKYKGKLYDLR